MNKFQIACLMLMVLLSCGKDLPELDGFDDLQWKNDRNACQGNRMSMNGVLEKEKVKLLGLGEVDMVRVLGQPDRNELFKRNQKFYYYFLEAAPECNHGNEKPLQLIIRFNAVGLAKEIELKRQ